MAVPATKRNLKIPLDYVPYLERHRIYELFFEIGSLLAVEKPKDHILFLRNFFYNMRIKRDRPRVVLLAPPHIDVEKLAYIMSKTLGAEPISFEDIVYNTPPGFEGLEPESVRLAETLRFMSAKEHILRKGWIIYGYPRTKIEGRVMLKLGVIPSHTLHIVPSHQIWFLHMHPPMGEEVDVPIKNVVGSGGFAEDSKNDAWHESLNKWSPEELQSAVEKYKINTIGLKEIFNSSLQEVAVRGRTLKAMAKICNEYVKICPFNRASMLYRVVLIGTRGSCRRTLASLLARNLNLVHVDMIQVLESGRAMDNELGEQIRRCDINHTRIFGYIIIELLRRRLLKKDCLDSGWVLTNFPRDRCDMEALDDFLQPPNRVIFLGADRLKCSARLKGRRINASTGCLVYPGLDKGPKAAAAGDTQKYWVHPNDRSKLVKEQQDYFSEHVQDLLNYCGDTCSVVSVTRGDIRAVMERLIGAVLGPTPVGEPRWKSGSPPRVIAPSSGIILRPSSVQPLFHDHLHSTMSTLYSPHHAFHLSGCHL